MFKPRATAHILLSALLYRAKLLEWNLQTRSK